jgi:hypothetical protein
MPSPTSSLATLRPDLATFAEFDLEMSRRGFIAGRVLPVFDVASQAGSFGKIPIEQLLQNRETKRAPGSGYSRGKWTFGTATYSCEEHGAEEPIDDREAAMYANYFNAEQVSTMRAYEAVLKNHEQRVADLLFNATTWTGAALTTAVGTEWSTVATATPVTDVEAAVRKVWDGCGMWPNALIINRHVFRNLRLCDQIIDMVKSQGFMDARPGSITEQQLATVFDLDQVIVAGSVKNSATEGQSASLASIWSNEYAMLARIVSSQDMREPGLGRTFHWGEDGSQPGGTIETYRDETIRGVVVRVRHDVDELVLYTEAAHLLSNITA